MATKRLLKTSRIIADIYVYLCRFQQYKIINHSSFGVTHVVLFHFAIGPMRHLSITVATNNYIVCHTMTTIIDWSPIIHSHPGACAHWGVKWAWPSAINTVKSEDWCCWCVTLCSPFIPHISTNHYNANILLYLYAYTQITAPRW